MNAEEFRKIVLSTRAWRQAVQLSERFYKIHTPLHVYARAKGTPFSRLGDQLSSVDTTESCSWQIVCEVLKGRAPEQYASAVDVDERCTAGVAEGFAIQARDSMYEIIKLAQMN